uniref:CD97 antigen-like n=1 Tax=Scophthalmus maximus TaxID=52904 RepID=A0A8D3DLQ1_SCOMX
MLGKCFSDCDLGFTSEGRECVDLDECKDLRSCGDHTNCSNTLGSFFCQCETGFTNLEGDVTFTGLSGQCQDKNECTDDVGICGRTANCMNLIGSYKCTCLLGYINASSTPGDCRGEQCPLLCYRTSSVTRRVVLCWDHNNFHAHETRSHSFLSFSGFAMAALLSYKNLKISVNRSFEELKGHEKDGVDPSFQVVSRVVSVVVSNPSTQNLSSSVNITLKHLEVPEEFPEVRYICAYWNEREAWSTDGCYEQHSNATHTVCRCEHLSSFAVLVALYPVKDTFGLDLVNKIGLIVSIVCLMLSILTFMFCRSIQGTRTTIHLHLCICLLFADIIFLAGISQTQPVGACRFVAAMLHYFFLAVFTWMLLEGVQLYRMVVLVFNATIRPLYLFVWGYGTPLVIVIISATIRPEGYGSDQLCWLSLKDGLIWSFLGPVCFIIIVNVLFFTITVWKLAQKFTSLNPELSQLHKIKAFTVTAIAQMCILGLMWVFGALLFQEGATHTATVAPYIFTLLNSIQGALVFILHCLLSKQVREEYTHFLSCICTPQKKRYSDFSSTNPSSSQSRVSTGRSHSVTISKS